MIEAFSLCYGPAIFLVVSILLSQVIIIAEEFPSTENTDAAK